ncbi:hypothetical protein GOBAR_AA39531 [Gossypium barbadense]|uniref:Uncharacterized protein n=1 Tax=Gossypium barbadense TaxID=3634 RepID=A0A2P5VQU4_GOSBA|nr:hypothetical protein GOBAR_AA39531 [Gossypium barbadense]
MEEDHTQNINPSTLAPKRNKFNIWNTETALKNQQASIQGLKTQISHIAKLISEWPQGSLPSNIESNPRKQLNAITIQDEEGLVEPEPKPSRPSGSTSKPNREIPLMVLSIFPYDTVEVIHPKFGMFTEMLTFGKGKHGLIYRRALGCAHTTGRDTAVRYGCVKAEQHFS